MSRIYSMLLCAMLLCLVPYCAEFKAHPFRGMSVNCGTMEAVVDTKC